MPRTSSRAKKDSPNYLKRVVVTGFGVEVEYGARPVQSERDAIEYRHRPYVSISSDYSVSVAGASHGSEVKLGPYHFDQLGGPEQALAKFRQTFAAVEEWSPSFRAVNGTCGTHIHIGLKYEDGTAIRSDWFNNRDMMRLIRSWRYFECVFFSIVPPSRRTREYCRPLCGADLASIRQLNAGRYRALNVESIPEHGTIEFRLPNGTVDRDEIEHWIKLLVSYINFALQTPLWRQSVRGEKSGNAERIKSRIRKLQRHLDPESRRFIRDRVEMFGGTRDVPVRADMEGVKRKSAET